MNLNVIRTFKTFARFDSSKRRHQQSNEPKSWLKIRDKPAEKNCRLCGRDFNATQRPDPTPEFLILSRAGQDAGHPEEAVPPLVRPERRHLLVGRVGRPGPRNATTSPTTRNPPGRPGGRGGRQRERRLGEGWHSDPEEEQQQEGPGSDRRGVGGGKWRPKGRESGSNFGNLNKTVKEGTIRPQGLVSLISDARGCVGGRLLQ